MQSFPCKSLFCSDGTPKFSDGSKSQRGNNRDRFGCGALTGRFLQGRPTGSAAFLPLQNCCCLPVISFPDPGKGLDLPSPRERSRTGVKICLSLEDKLWLSVPVEIGINSTKQNNRWESGLSLHLKLLLKRDYINFPFP